MPGPRDAPGAELPGLRKLAGDARIIRVGTRLRKTSLDELHRYEPTHLARFDVRPGLTGLWQVSGRTPWAVTRDRGS